MKRRRVLLTVLLALIAIGAFGYAVLSHRAPVLTAVTWAGPYGRAQASALYQPFAQRTGIDMRIAQYEGGLEQLRKGASGWDVIDMELPDAVAACREGLLEKIDAATLPAGLHGEPASTDFVAGALGPCWVGSMVYSQVIAYAPRRFDARPGTLADFFDTARFPGGRALRGGAKANLEMALLADGVAPADIYKVLATPGGVARALAKLDTLRGRIVWWSRSGEPAAMLADGRAAFATILNGDLADALAHGGALGTIWDRQLYELDVFAIPKGDAKRIMALDFVRFATSAPGLAGVADWVPYGPARRSAVALVGRNPETGAAMRPLLPTAPENFATAFAVDDAWWQAHGAAIAPRWEAWKSLPNGK
jgi:putative spermidine/putrescine transport system substrate-binding protein